MKTFFRHFRFGAFAVAILCMALGAAILFWPDMSQQVFCYIFGGTLCLCGVFQIASYLVGSQKNLLAKMMFLGGVIAAVAGVWILFDPSKVLTLTVIVMGIVLLYHGVTLGGTGKDHGKRHPTIGNNVLIGCGAKILGPFKVGDGARIAANSVVLSEVPENATAVGIPAQIVRIAGQITHYADDVDQTSVNNPMLEQLAALTARVEELEQRANQK